MDRAELGTNAVSRLAWRFEQNGLAVPPVPAAVESQLREFDDWAFATSLPEYPPYDIDAHVETALTDWPDGSLLVAHDGHGMNSWAIHYFIVLDQMACFLQLPWGGAFSDAALDSERIARRFAELRALLDTPITDGCRLAVIETLHAGAWSPVSLDGERYRWRDSDDPLNDALNAVRAGRLSTLLDEPLPDEVTSDDAE